jgi:hypothetical protein
MTDKLLHWHVTYRAYTAEGHVHNYLVTKSPGGDCWLAMKKLATLQTPVYDSVPGPRPRTRRAAMDNAEAFEVRVLAGG